MGVNDVRCGQVPRLAADGAGANARPAHHGRNYHSTGPHWRHAAIRRRNCVQRRVQRGRPACWPACATVHAGHRGANQRGGVCTAYRRNGALFSTLHALLACIFARHAWRRLPACRWSRAAKCARPAVCLWIHWRTGCAASTARF